MRDDVYLGGVAVSAYLTPITLMKGFYAPPPPTGQDYILPGYPGARPAELGQGVLTVTVGGTIVGSTDPCNPRVIPTRDQYIAKLMAFKSIAYQNNRPFTIGFTSGGFSGSTLARYMSGLEDVADINGWSGRIAVDFALLTPYWS